MSIIRTENFLKNMKINFIFYLINIFILFISRSIFIKLLGTEIAGLNSLYNSLIGLLNIAELGIGGAIGYSLYKPLKDNDYQKIKDIMELFKYYYSIVSKIIFVLGLILSLFLPFLIKGQVNIIEAYIYYFMYLINCSISYLFTYKQTLIIADQKQYKISYILNISKIIKVVIQCITIYITKSFVLWLLIEILFNILSMYLTNNKIDLEYNDNLKFTNNKSIKLIKKENFEIGKNIKNIFFHKIGTFVIFQTDSIIITAFSTLKETAIYANYIMIINSLSGLISTAIGSIMPSVGNFIAEKSDDEIYKKFRTLYLFDNILALFISLVTYQIINEFIVFWVGKEYLFSSYIVLTLIINLYIQISRGTIDRFKSCYGIYWDISAPIIESIVNLISSIYLAYKIGIIGVFIGTIISNIIIVGIWKPYILFKEGFKKNIYLYIKQSMIIYVKNIIICLIVNYCYKNCIYKLYLNNIFINIIIHFILVSILCFLLIILFYFKNIEFKEIINIIKYQFIKKIKCKFN